MDKRLAKRLRKAIKNWWMHLLLGLIFIGAGVWSFITPFSEFAGLAILLATVMLVSGFFEIFFALINRNKIDNWGWYFVGALVDFAIGLVLIFFPGFTLTILPWIIAFWMLAKGFSAIAISIGLRQYRVRIWLLLMVAGVATLLFSLLIFANPILGGVSLIYMTALALISHGFFRILLAFRLRTLHVVFEDRMPEGLKAI